MLTCAGWSGCASAPVQLSPSGAQTGTINASGNITSLERHNRAAVLMPLPVGTALTLVGQCQRYHYAGCNTTMSASFYAASREIMLLNLGSTTAAAYTMMVPPSTGSITIRQSPVRSASYILSLPDTGTERWFAVFANRNRPRNDEPDFDPG